jgi:hypothetical protein
MESRWPGLVQPDIRHLQQLPFPPRPTSASQELLARLGPEQPSQPASAQLLQQVISLLDPVDVRNM